MCYDRGTSPYVSFKNEYYIFTCEYTCIYNEYVFISIMHIYSHWGYTPMGIVGGVVPKGTYKIH